MMNKKVDLALAYRQQRESIRMLHNRIDIVLQLHHPDEHFNCAECCRFARFPVAYPCSTAVALGE